MLVAYVGIAAHEQSESRIKITRELAARFDFEDKWQL